MDPIKRKAYSNLGIPESNRVILSIDGGGMRGIFTLQLLKKLEEVAGAPCHKWCDMVAGTSTGAIIAGLMLKGKSASEIEELYKQLVSRVFTKRGVLSNRFANPPAFDKKNYRKLLKDIIGNDTLKECSTVTGLDVLITSKDTSAGEETFFTCFNITNQDNSQTFLGTYKDVLLRGVMEATMSAPTYFSPFERFVDGGTTTFNNPVGAAVLEALVYDGRKKYDRNNLTVFSFGTGTTLRFYKPQDVANPNGLDAYFWLNYVMDETGKDASEMQIDTLRSGLFDGISLRRYQLSLDEDAIRQLPDKDISDIAQLEADWLHQLKNADLAKIDMADVTKFPLMQRIGEAMAEKICPADEKDLPLEKRKANWFKEDLINKNTKRGTFVTSFGDKDAILSHLSNPDWIDKQPTV